MKKQAVVIGLGRFGSSMAQELYQVGHDVLAMDQDEKNVQDAMGTVTYAVRGDATSRSLLLELGVQNSDVAVVAIGSDIQASILVTVLLKSLNIPFIIARSSSQLHGDTLERIGADKVVYPEQEMGKRLAHVDFHPGVIDYIDVSSDYGITKMRPPDHMMKRTLEEAGVSGPRDKYGLAILAIRRGRECVLLPSKDEQVMPGDILIVAGSAEQLGRFHLSPREAEQRSRAGFARQRTPRRAF